MTRWGNLIGLAMLPALVHSFASTDSTQDADPPQSGYLPNHNINPASVAASTFTSSWTNTYNALEVFYAKPLVYTPTGAPNEYVIVVSNQNIVRIINGLTGALITTRTLDAPFASTDTNCGDIPNTVGITGTPIIDSATDTMYFFSKGYKNGQAGPQGTINGQYKFYAVKIPSLADVAGFPVIIDGHYANNDPTRYFVGGTVLNRPGLAMIGNTVVGGFGGHCDNFNYTGMLVAVSKTPNVGVTNIQAMEASPGAPSPQTLDITIQGGGKAGIWHSGMGIAADTNRVFLVTGNARGAGQNGGATGAPASGKTYLSTLEQAVVDFSVNPTTGALTQADYFEPYAYDSNNGGDRDFGSSGVALLDPSTFSGTGVSRIAVAGGKDGKVYIMNADNLGGFAGGTAGTDNVIQTIVNANALLSGAASYPLEGGYLYLQPVNDVLYAYKFGHDSTGKPMFTLAGKSALTFAGKSVPTVTSLDGQTGSGIVWLADTNKGLLAFNAVPVNGVLTQIALPNGAATGGLTKYQRAVFGNGRAYVSRANSIQAIGGGGQALSLPLTCTPSPVAFGSVLTTQTSTIQVTCKANTAVTITGCTVGLATFQCGNSSLPKTVASGASFTFPVAFNLSDANIIAYENAGNGEVLPGAESTTLNLHTTAAASGFAGNTLVQLSGNVVASSAYLVINQTTVDFGGVVTGGPQSKRSIILSNKGSSVLTFTGFAWQNYYATGMPFNNVSVSATSTVGFGYTASLFPAVGSQLAPGASITIPLFFGPSVAGISASYLTFWSDGGYMDLLMTGTATQGTTTSSSSQSLTSSSTKSSSSTLSTSSTKSSTSSTKSTTTSSSTTSSTIVPTTTSTTKVSTGPSSNSATSTTSVHTTLVTSKSATITPTAPAGPFKYSGCFQDIGTGHALPLLFSNNSVTPELCEAYVQSLASKPTPTVLPYYFVEYHNQCYGGSSFNWGASAVTSLTGTKACTDVCSGSIGAAVTGTAKCGGPKQFNLYAASGAAPLIPASTVSR